MRKLKILHLEDDSNDVFLVRRVLARHGLDAEVLPATNQEEFLSTLHQGGLDFILVDSGVPGFSGRGAMDIAREHCPQVPLILVSGLAEEKQALKSLQTGAVDYVLKDHLWQLVAVIKRKLHEEREAEKTFRLGESNAALQKLANAARNIARARHLDAIMSVVRTAARELTGADGASFILAEGDQCVYADEEAIAPLWKGQKFPMGGCASGWAMLNGRALAIEDVASDDRTPPEVYNATFVKSLAIVPIRTKSPLGALGVYWAARHETTGEELALLERLADLTSAAMEDVQLRAELDQRAESWMHLFEQANQELESFSYSISHDLRAPLRGIDGMLAALADDFHDKLDSTGQFHIDRARASAGKMRDLIDGLLRLSRFGRVSLEKRKVNLSRLAREAGEGLRTAMPERTVEFVVGQDILVEGDPNLLGALMDNLLANAWKYTSKLDTAKIEFGTFLQPAGEPAFFVRDNGAGFDMNYAEKLFCPFQRFHREEDFPGTGIGLAIAQRIVHRHGGKIWADAAVDKGATFYFTLWTQDVAEHH